MSPAWPAQAQVQPSLVQRHNSLQNPIRNGENGETAIRKEARDIKFPTNVGTCHLDPLGSDMDYSPDCLTPSKSEEDTSEAMQNVVFVFEDVALLG